MALLLLFFHSIHLRRNTANRTFHHLPPKACLNYKTTHYSLYGEVENTVILLPITHKKAHGVAATAKSCFAEGTYTTRRTEYINILLKHTLGFDLKSVRFPTVGV